MGPRVSIYLDLGAHKLSVYNTEGSGRGEERSVSKTELEGKTILYKIAVGFAVVRGRG